MDKVDHDDSDAIQEELSEVKRRWDELQAKSNDRQQNLEESLYHLGQFSTIVEEVFIWIEQIITIICKKKSPLKEKWPIEVEDALLKVRS